MTRIVVRAADSALAMDEVLRRLGPNAYILSTSQHKGLVEIQAASELPSPAAAEPEEPRPSVFADLLKMRLARKTGPVAPTTSPGLRAKAAAQGLPPVAAVVLPEVGQPLGGWPVLEPAYVAALGADLAAREPAAEGPLARLIAVAGQGGTVESVLAQGRVVLIGGAEAGVSLLAARLAAQAMRADDRCRPRLIAPRNAPVLVEGPLRGWARLLGLGLERPVLHDLSLSASAQPGDALRPEIIDLSDLPEAGPDKLAALAGQPAEILLVLPAGLHPRRLARACAPWAGLATGVCLTGIDKDGPAPEELTVLASAGLPLRLVARGSDLLDALQVPGPDDMRGWAEGWIAEAQAETALRALIREMDPAEEPTQDLAETIDAAAAQAQDPAAALAAAAAEDQPAAAPLPAAPQPAPEAGGKPRFALANPLFSRAAALGLMPAPVRHDISDPIAEEAHHDAGPQLH